MATSREPRTHRARVLISEDGFRPDGAILTGDLIGPWDGVSKWPGESWRIRLDFAFEERGRIVREIVIAARHVGYPIVPGKRGGTVNICLVNADEDPPVLEFVARGGASFPRPPHPYMPLVIIFGILVAEVGVIAVVTWLIQR